ncbi:hypothetical protein QOZ80_7BG0611860 [Eleusine coracana subsp. coracana]|nr:hypothetical protein QOZ80_7BG0611860 [Eleusine coracana subsp. coracana]
MMMPPRRVRMAGHCLMLASCDGVLLFKKDQGLYLLCNPVTRRWAELPRLADEIYHAVHDVEYAFYHHHPSGEYRLLCGCRTWSGSGGDRAWAWCVLSTGAAEPRRVDHTDVEAAAGLFVPCLRSATSQPAALHGRLHWPPYRDVFKGPTTVTTTMVTFDTVSETFRSMTGPPSSSALVKLFVMDGNKIVVADFGKGNRLIDLWVLEDYYYGAHQRWERRHQVAMPWGWSMSSENPSYLLSVAALADDQGNVMLGNHDYGLVVYNVRRKTARRVNTVATPHNNVLMSRHVFRESLVQLPCFKVPTTADMPLIHFWN